MKDYNLTLNIDHVMAVMRLASLFAISVDIQFNFSAPLAILFITRSCFQISLEQLATRMTAPLPGY